MIQVAGARDFVVLTCLYGGRVGFSEPPLSTVKSRVWCNPDATQPILFPEHSLIPRIKAKKEGIVSLTFALSHALIVLFTFFQLDNSLWVCASVAAALGMIRCACFAGTDCTHNSSMQLHSSYAACVGQMRGLEQLGLLAKADYTSCVSGGQSCLCGVQSRISTHHSTVMQVHGRLLS